MTPKQKYEEAKRLRLERRLHDEQRLKSQRDRQEQGEEMFMRLVAAMERIADVAELWAEKQS